MQITPNLTKTNLINTRYNQNKYQNAKINYQNQDINTNQNINFKSNISQDFKKVIKILKFMVKLQKLAFVQSKQVRKNFKTVHIDTLNYFKNILFASFGDCPRLYMEVFEKLPNPQRLATVQLKCRNKAKTVKAEIEKFDLGDGRSVYLLVQNNRQIAHLKATKTGNDVEIGYMTNVLARKKYRNTENILVQTLVEDCANQGFIPKITATAVTFLDDRKMSNKNLYQRMGMTESSVRGLEISPEKVLQLAQQRAKKNGEIIKGSVLNFVFAKKSPDVNV